MNIQNYLFNLTTLSLSIFVSNLAYADTENVATQQLATIAVMANRGGDLKDMDISTTIIQHEQIQNSPQTTLDQIINKIPGIFAPARLSTQLHPTGQFLNIRGLGTSTNGLSLVLIDGVPANDPYFRTVNWAQIPKEQVESIEVIRGGGATSLWGNMAMGGVINIVTRKPHSGTDVYASYGRFNTSNYGVSQGIELSDQLRMQLSYDGSYSDGYWQTPKQYRNPYMSKTQTQVDTFNYKAIYTPNDKDEYALSMLANQTKENGLQYENAKNEWNSYRISLNAKNQITPDWQLNNLVWYQSNEMNTQNVSNPSYSLANPNSGIPYISQIEFADYHNLGASSTLSTEWKFLQDIKLGVDYRQIWIKDPLNIYNSSNNLGQITAQATHQFAGIFAQAMYRSDLLPLDITLGLRQDFWRASDAKTYGEYKGSSIQNSLDNQNESHFNPRLGFKYQLNDLFALRGATYKNFSAPGLNQTYRSFISGSGYTVPNTNLSSQTNHGSELGFDFNQQSFSLSGTYFYNQINHYIDYATVRSDCTSSNNYCNTGVNVVNTLRQYVNAGDAKTQGFELLANWQVNRQLSLNTSYTHTKAVLTNTSLSPTVEPINQQLGQIPKWFATLGATWQASDKLNLNVQLRDFADYWNNTIHTQKNQGEMTVDLSANYRATPQLQLFVDAQNIGNRSYYDQGLTYLPNGMINTSSSGTIPQYALPFNFTVGAKYHF